MPWTPKEHEGVLKTLAVVCEVTQTTFSEPAMKLIRNQLENYPSRQVLKALERCAAECRYKLTLADIISRLDDGRPGVEEAWSAFPKSEDEAAVVTDEMAVAWGVASELYASDRVGARMAFKETYEREVRNARAAGTPPRWFMSAGFSKPATEAAAIEGLRKGLLSREQAMQYILPENEAQALHAAGIGPPALPPPEQAARVKQLVAGVLERLDANGRALAPKGDRVLPPGDRE